MTEKCGAETTQGESGSMSKRVIKREIRQGLIVDVYIIEGEPGIHHEAKGHVCEAA